MVGAMVEGGVDIIELGAPFSDPLAEGPTVQRSSQVALDQNVTLADCLDCCRNDTKPISGRSVDIDGILQSAAELWAEPVCQMMRRRRV